MGVTGRLAGLAPFEVDPDTAFRRSVAFLGTDAGPEALLSAGYVLAAGTGLVLAGLAQFLPPELRLAGLLCAVTCGLLGTSVAHRLPKLLATARRTRTLGAAPDLVARAVLRMRVSPAAERAAAFAVETGDGPLAASLGRHVRGARSTGRTGLSSFGSEWDAWFPSLDRALALVEAAGAVPEDRRDQVLDRALDTVLDGMRTQMQEYATRIGGPATALYAFGVLLPTALVALLPAARTAGLAVTPLTVALVYDLLVPLVVVTGGAWLVARRPVAFPPPRVTPAHPAVTDRRRTAVAAGVCAGGTGWLVAATLAPGWAPPLVAAGWGVGALLLARYRPGRDLQERVRRAERDLADALSLVGRRVASGESIEAAVAAASEDVRGPMGDLLAAGARRQHHLQVGLEEAFLGDRGVLGAFPSRRLRASVAMVALAGREGRPAGGAVLSLADHVTRLERVEADARADLESVCSTLRSTGAVFCPLVAGATVALAAGMTGGGFVAGPGMPWLGGVVGIYALALAVLLPALATGLERGFDRVLVGCTVGRALLLAPAVYLASYLLVGGLA